MDKCIKLTQGFGPANPNQEFDRLVELGHLYKAFFAGLTKPPVDVYAHHNSTSRKVVSDHSNKHLPDLQHLLERHFDKSVI